MKIKSFLLSLGIVVSQQMLAGNPGVSLLLKNGQKISFCFSKSPTFVVNNDELIVNEAGVPKASFSYSEVQNVQIVEDVNTGIIAVPAIANSTHKVFQILGGKIAVSGLSKAEHVSFYSVGGQLILQEKGHDDGTLSVSLTSLPKGICIVLLQSGVSYKFFNK